MGRPKRESTSVTKTFADRLSDLVEGKKATGLNHNEICEQAGVGSGAMSDWLSDNKTANIDSLCKLAKYFNVSADWLLGLSDIRSVVGNEQSAASLGLPDNFIDYILFLDANLELEKETLKMVLEDEDFHNAITAITLIRTALYNESDAPKEIDFSALDTLREELFAISGGTQSIVHSGLVVDSLLYSASKSFGSVAERCMKEFSMQQNCYCPLTNE